MRHADPKLHTDLPHSGQSLTSNGRYLFVHTGSAIYKISTGFGGSVRGRVDGRLEHASDAGAADVPWLGCVDDLLFVRARGDTPGVFMALNADTLEVVGAVTQDEGDSTVGDLPYCLFTRHAGELGVLEDTENGWRARIFAIAADSTGRKLITKETLLLSPAAQRIAACGAKSWHAPEGRKTVRTRGGGNGF